MIADDLIVERGVSAGDEWITVPAAQVWVALSALRDDPRSLLEQWSVAVP